MQRDRVHGEVVMEAIRYLFKIELEPRDLLLTLEHPSSPRQPLTQDSTLHRYSFHVIHITLGERETPLETHRPD